MGILDTIASPIESVIKSVESFAAPKAATTAPSIVTTSPTIAQSTPATMGLQKPVVFQTPPANIKSVISAPITSVVKPPAQTSITSVIAKPINSVVPSASTINTNTKEYLDTQSTTLEQNSKAIDTENANLTAMQKQIDTAKAKVDDTDQNSIDQYNAMINNYNTRAEALQSKVTNYNATVSDYKSKVSAFNMSGGATLSKPSGNETLAPEQPQSLENENAGALAPKGPGTALKDFFFKPQPIKLTPAFTNPDYLPTIQGPKSIEFVNNLIQGLVENVAALPTKLAATFTKSQTLPLPFGLSADNFSRVTGITGKDAQTYGQDYFDNWATADAASGLTGKNAINSFNPISLFHGTISGFNNVISPALITADVGIEVRNANTAFLEQSGFQKTLGLKYSELSDLDPKTFNDVVTKRTTSVVNDIFSDVKSGKITMAEGRAKLSQISQEFHNLGDAYDKELGVKDVPNYQADQTGSKSYTVKPTVQYQKLSVIGKAYEDIAIALSKNIDVLGKTTGFGYAGVDEKALPGYRAEPGQASPVGLSTERVEPVGFHDYQEPTVDNETGQVTQAKTRQDVKSVIAKPISEVVGTAKVGDTEVPIKAGGNIEIPEKKPATLFDTSKEKPPVYQGEKDLTTQTLQKLVGRSTVSKTFIENLTNQPDLKQQEREVVRAALTDYKDGSQVPVQEFAQKVKAELLPLQRGYTSGDTGTRYEHVSLPDELKGNVKAYSEQIYQSPIATSAGNVHYSQAKAYSYFGHTRIEDLADNSTRRVIEVQSDLYQKGRLDIEKRGDVPSGLNKSDIKPSDSGFIGKSHEITFGKGTVEDPQQVRFGTKESLEKSIDEANTRASGVVKLQQYNDPTAHFRMVREEIKKAAEDGKTKLQFPTGETAMKIEGLGNTNNWSVNDRTVRLRPSMLKVGLEINQGAGINKWIVTDVLGDGKFKAVPKSQVDEVGSFALWQKAINGEVKIPEYEFRPSRDSIETFDISGKVDTNNPIYRFYEKDLGRYLQKFGAQRVTDAQGVSWYEVPTNKGMATQPVTAFSRGLGKFDMHVDVAQALVRQYFTKQEAGILFSDDLGKNVAGKFQIARFRNTLALLTKGDFVSGAVAYHEIFHGLFQLKFSVEEQEAAIAKINNDPKLKALVDVKYSQYAPKERAEEWLADDFAKFKQGPKEYTGFFRNLWEKLLNYIRDLIRRGNAFEDLYKEAEARRGTGEEVAPVTRLKVSDTEDLDGTEVASAEQSKEKPLEEEKNNKSEIIPGGEDKTVQEGAKQTAVPAESKVVASPKSVGLGRTNVNQDRSLISERGPEEATIRPRTRLQEEANKQYLKSARTEAEVDLPKKEVMEIRRKETSVRAVYNADDKTKAEGALATIINEMDASEKGSRTMIGTGAQRTFSANPSTFPKWVPEGLRSRALFDKVIGRVDSLQNLHYPDRTVSLREAKLVDAIYNQIDERVGVNTKSLREGITGAYTAEGRLQAQDTDVTNKLLEKEYRKTAKMVREEEEEKQRAARIKKAAEEFQKNQKASDARITEHETNIKQAIKEAGKKEGIIKGIARDLNPVAKLPVKTKAIVEQWLTDRAMAPVKAKEEFQKYPGHEKEGMNTIIAQQDGAKIPYLTQAFENLHTESNRRGLDVHHRDDYMPQVWKQTPEEIHKIIAKRMEAQGLSEKEIKEYLAGDEKLDKSTSARLKLNPFFSKEKVVPDYRTGIAMGLTPKYDNPVQLIAHYRQSMELGIANRNLAEKLKQNGDLLPTDLNEKPAGFKETSIFGRSYFAPGHLADFLNDFLRTNDNLSWQQQLAHNAAVVSRVVQNIGLMTGIPGTTFQAFPTAMLYAEVMGRGNIKAILPYLRANSNALTAKWVENNWDIIKKMTEDGVSVGDLTEGDWSKQNLLSIIKDTNIFDLKSGLSTTGQVFNRLYQAKTFDRLIPMLSVDLYKGVYTKQIAKGVPEMAARKLAADTVKNLYVQRNPQGKTTSEFMRSIFYGPVWREQVMKMFGKVVQGYSTEFKNQAFRQNRVFLLGLLGTFVAYQIIQHKENGTFTWNNPSGHELDLTIPQKDGSNVYVTYFPSLMTVPRLIVGTGTALVKGDVAAAAGQVAGLANAIVQNLYSLFANKDYYGRPIYKPNDSAATKYEKLGAYFGSETFTPGFLRSVIGYASGQNTGVQALTGLTGGILKYQSAHSILSDKTFNENSKKSSDKAAAKEKLQPIFDQIQTLKFQLKTAAANKLYATLSASDKLVYKEMLTAAKTANTKARKPEIQQMYDSNQALKAEGKTNEANTNFAGLSADDKRIYNEIKKADQKKSP